MKVLLIDSNKESRSQAAAVIHGSLPDLERVELSSLGSLQDYLTCSGADCAITELSLPDGNGFDVYQAIHAVAPDTPVVMLTGAGDELTAAAALKAGFADYLPKSAINRLPEVLQNVLGQQTTPRLVRQILKRNEDQFRRVFDTTKDGLIIIDGSGLVVEWNRGLETFTGLLKQDVIGRSFSDAQALLAPADIPSTPPLPTPSGIFNTNLQTLHSFPIGEFREDRIRRTDGKCGNLVSFSLPVSMEQGDYLCSFIHDITPHATRMAELDLCAQQQSIEINRIRSSIEETKTLYQKLIEILPDAVVVLSMDFTILFCNEQALRLYNATSPSDLIGRNGADLFPEQYRGGVDIHQILACDAVRNIETLLPRMDGQLFPAKASFIAIRNDSGQAVSLMVHIRDLTEEKQAQEDLLKYAQRSSAIHQISTMIAAKNNLPTLLDLICEQTAQAMMMPAAIMYLYDAETDSLTYAASFGRPEDTLRQHPPLQRSLFESMIARWGPVVVIRDVQKFSDVQNAAIYAAVDMRTIVIAPMMYGNRLVGSLSIYTYGAIQNVSQEDINLAQAISDQAAVAVENAYLVERTLSRARTLETLNQVSSALRKAESIEEMLPLIIRETARVASADMGLALFYQGKRLIIEGGDGTAQAWIGTEIDPDIWIKPSRRVEDFLFIADFDILPNEPGNQVFFNTGKGIKSLVFLPLQASQKVFGYLCIGYSKGHHFPDDERKLLSAMMNIAGNALQRVRMMKNLEAELTDRTRELNALNRITEIVNRTTNLKQDLDKTLESIIAATGCPGGFIQIWHPKGSISAIHISVGLPEKVVQEIIASCPQNNGNPSAPLESSESLNVPLRFLIQCSDDGDRYEFLRIPIRIGTVELGCLILLQDEQRGLIESDIVLLQSMADAVALGVENAHLREQAEQSAVQAERYRLSRELHDSVTQSIYSLTLFAEAGKQAVPAGRYDLIQNSLDQISEIAQQSLKELRLLVFELRPAVLEKNGMVGAIRHRLDAVERRAGVNVSFDCDTNVQPPDYLEEGMYFIAQEALNNSLKHAHANEVKVSIHQDQHGLILEIADKGVGFDLHSRDLRKGVGLASMQERAQKLNGEVSFHSRTGEGTRVQLILPISLPQGN